MLKPIRKLQTTLRPKPDSKAWFDILMLIIFGFWFIAPIISWLTFIPDPNAYKCNGPGFADFGCTGGWEAVIASIFGAAFMTIVAAVTFIAVGRLVYRFRRRTSSEHTKDG